MVEKIGNSPEQKAFKKEEPVDLLSLQNDIQKGSSSAFFNEEREGVISVSNAQSKKKKKSTPKSKYSPSNDEEKEKLVAVAVDAIQEEIAKNKKEDDPTDIQSLIETIIPKDKNEIFDTAEEDIDPIILFSELSDDAQRLLQDRMAADNKELFKQGNFLLPDVIAILQQNGFKEEVDGLAGETVIHDYSGEDKVNDTIFRDEAKKITTTAFEREESVVDNSRKSKIANVSNEDVDTVSDVVSGSVFTEKETVTRSEAFSELEDFNNQLQYYSLSEAGVSVINEQKSLSAKKHMLELLLKEAPEVKPETAEDAKEAELHVSVEDKEAKTEIEQSAIIRVKDFSPALQSYFHKLAEKGFMTFKEYDNDAIIVGKDLDELKEQELFVDEIERLQSAKVSPHATETFDKAIPEAERDYSEVESFTNTIRNAKTFNDMYQAVDTIDYVEGTLGFYTKSQLKHLIGMVERGEQDPVVITQNAGLRAKVYELLGYDGEVAAGVVENTKPETNESVIGIEDALQNVANDYRKSTIGNDNDEVLEKVTTVKENDEILSFKEALDDITDEEKESTIGDDGEDEPLQVEQNNEITQETFVSEQIADSEGVIGLEDALEEVTEEEKESPLRSETPENKIKREFKSIISTYLDSYKKLKESEKSESLIDKIKNKFGSSTSEHQKRFDSVRELYASKVFQYVPVLFQERLSAENEYLKGKVCFGDLNDAAKIQLQLLDYNSDSKGDFKESTEVIDEDLESLIDGGFLLQDEMLRIRKLDNHAGVAEEVQIHTWSDMFITERDALFEIEASVFDKKSMTIAQRLLSKVNKKETPETTVGKTRWETLIKLS